MRDAEGIWQSKFPVYAPIAAVIGRLLVAAAIFERAGIANVRVIIEPKTRTGVGCLPKGHSNGPLSTVFFMRFLPARVTTGNASRKCPRCFSPCVRRSRTRIWQWPLRWLFARPYRCRDCERRFYVFDQSFLKAQKLRLSRNLNWRTNMARPTLWLQEKVSTLFNITFPH